MNRVLPLLVRGSSVFSLETLRSVEKNNKSGISPNDLNLFLELKRVWSEKNLQKIDAHLESYKVVGCENDANIVVGAFRLLRTINALEVNDTKPHISPQSQTINDLNSEEKKRHTRAVMGIMHGTSVYCAECNAQLSELMRRSDLQPAEIEDLNYLHAISSIQSLKERDAVLHTVCTLTTQYLTSENTSQLCFINNFSRMFLVALFKKDRSCFFRFPSS